MEDTLQGLRSKRLDSGISVGEPKMVKILRKSLLAVGKKNIMFSRNEIPWSGGTPLRSSELGVKSRPDNEGFDLEGKKRCLASVSTKHPGCWNLGWFPSHCCMDCFMMLSKFQTFPLGPSRSRVPCYIRTYPSAYRYVVHVSRLRSRDQPFVVNQSTSSQVSPPSCACVSLRLSAGSWASWLGSTKNHQKRWDWWNCMGYHGLYQLCFFQLIRGCVSFQFLPFFEYVLHCMY